MQIIIADIMKEIGVQEDYEQTYKKQAEILERIAIGIVRANESREEISITTQSPFYGRNRELLNFITIEPITIDRLPTILAFHHTYHQNIQPFVKESQAREEVKQTIRELVQFIYNIDLRVTSQMTRKEEERSILLYSNYELLFLYELALNIIGNYSRLPSIMLSEKNA